MKKVPTIEVKRCFVIGDMIKAPVGRNRFLRRISTREFKHRLTVAKKRVLAMSEAELDKHISPTWKRRIRSYNNAIWYLAIFSVTDLGVWKRAGGLPLAWTKNSLADTASAVREALKNNPRKLFARARYAIPSILGANVHLIQSEKYLLPIAFKGGTGTNGRRGLPRMKGDLDDGCMRSISLVIHGKKRIKIYFGVPKRR